jgi:hypothetical protein
MTAALSGSVFVAKACLCGTPGPQDPSPGGGSEATANLFAVASGGSPNCTRSSTLKNYADAVTAGAVCGPGVRTSNGSINGTGFGNACHAATGGDKVAVRNGAYAQNPANGYLFDGNLDCSDGTGADYNPNWEEQGVSQGSLANWVTFVPGESPAAITFTVGSMTIPRGNYHMIWEGIDVNTGIRFNSGGETPGQRAENIIMRGSSSSNRATIYGIQVTGSKNILFQHIDNGPSNQCAKNDSNVPVAWRCNPSGPWFEAQYANFGTTTSSCNMQNGNHTLCGGFWANGGSEWAELYVHDGGAGAYQNIRFEDFINHDQQSIQDSTVAAHPGCLMTYDTGNATTSSHNMVLDGYVCERATGATIQLADSGVTIQNSTFGCQVQSLQNSGGIWDGTCVAAAFGYGQKNPGSGGGTNVLIRYNYFGPGSNGLTINTSATGNFQDVTNFRVIGNVFAGGVTCGVTGVTYANNAFVNGVSTCGIPAQSLSAGDPVVNSSYDTPDNLYKLKGPTIDARADGSPAISTINPTSLGADYQLGWDIDREARSSTATRPGVDG